MLEQLRQAHGKHGRARVARLQARHFGAQIRFQHAHADAATAGNQHEIAARLLQQREEDVLQVDFILPQADTKAGRARGGRAAGVVQLADQCFQVDAHGEAVLVG
ncbi:hypothetical protein D3C81_1953440 [compost metagenome]